MTRLEAVALGTADADVVVADGTVVLPESLETRQLDVAIADGRVAALTPDASDVVGGATTVVDAEGCHVTPGFVDAHTHSDVLQTVGTTYHRSLLGGTTAVVTETSSYASVFGADGVRALLDATTDLPLAVRPAVPPQGFTDTFEPPASEDDRDAVRSLLDNERVVGVGEIPWIHVVGRDSPVEDLVTAAHDRGKSATGHGAGLSGEKLQAFASLVDDDHEAISGKGVVERVAAGVHAVGRSGSIRDDADAVAEGWAAVGHSEISLSTDGTWPGFLLDSGHVDEVLRRVIDAGVPPVDAVRMATLNPARHFGFDGRGSLSPGSVADVVVLSDLESVAVRDVLFEGERVVVDGEALVEPRTHEYPDRFFDSVGVTPSASDFVVPTDTVEGSSVRAIEHRPGLVTGETVVEPNVVEGASGEPGFRPAPERDVLAVALFDRTPGGEGDGFVGFVEGLGLAAGAAATTLTWEQPGLLVVGADHASMAAAAGRVAEMGGGWAVVQDNEVIADLALPVAGTAAQGELRETAEGLQSVDDALASLGCEDDRPVLGLQTMTFVGVPALKLSLSGYADVLDRSVVGLEPAA